MFEVPQKQLNVHGKLYGDLGVLYVLAGCRHCPVMQQRIEKLLRAKDGAHMPIALVWYDKDVHEAGIHSFPTLRKFRDGVLQTDSLRGANHDEDELKKFLVHATGAGA